MNAARLIVTVVILAIVVVAIIAIMLDNDKEKHPPMEYGKHRRVLFAN